MVEPASYIYGLSSRRCYGACTNWWKFGPIYPSIPDFSCSRLVFVESNAISSGEFTGVDRYCSWPIRPSVWCRSWWCGWWLILRWSSVSLSSDSTIMLIPWKILQSLCHLSTSGSYNYKHLRVPIEARDHVRQKLFEITRTKWIHLSTCSCRIQMGYLYMWNMLICQCVC